MSILGFVLSITIVSIPVSIQLTSISYKSVKINWNDIEAELADLSPDPTIDNRQNIMARSFLEGEVYKENSPVDVTVVLSPGKQTKPNDNITVFISSASISAPWTYCWFSFQLKQAAFDKKLGIYAVVLGDVCDSDTRDFRGSLDKSIVPESMRSKRKKLQDGNHKMIVKIYVNDKLYNSNTIGVQVTR